MLTKLLKYDFKAMFNVLLPVYAVLIFLSLFNRLAEFLSDKLSILQIPAGFISVIYVIVLIGTPIATFVIAITRYYKNLAGDEGYLMHTLPVTKKDLVLSKLISYFVTLLVSVIVALIGLFIGEYGIKFNSDTLNNIINTLKAAETLTVVLTTITIIISIIFQQLLMYASIALGQKQNTNKVIYSIVFGIVLYNINQIISAVILLLPILFNRELFDKLNNNNMMPSVLNGYLGASIIISILFVFGYFFLTTRTLEKNLNLE
jgi:uncharacterized membrane protein (DUF485 family)